MARAQKNTQPLTTAQRLSSIVKSCRDIMRKDKGLNGDLDRLPMLTWIMFLKFLDDVEQIAEQEAQMAGKRFRPALEAPYRWRDWAAKADGITGDELISFVNNEEAVRPDGKKAAGLFAYLRGLQGANGGDRRDVIATVFKGTINRMINGYLLRGVINKITDIHFTSSDEIHTLGHLYESMAHRQRARLRIDAAPRRSRFPSSWKLDLQAQPRGCIIYLRRTDARGRVSLLGHSFIVDRTWPHRLVRAHVDLIAEQIKFFALRRREPNSHRLLNTVAYHLPKRKFIDVRKFSNN